MIRDLVFDLGNVLIRFEPEKELRRFVQTDGEAAALRDRIYLSGPWKDSDRGLIGREECICRLCALYPEQEELLRAVLSECSEWLTMPETIPPFLSRMREKGYGLFFLSNTNPGDFASMTERIPSLRDLDGGVASFKEGVLKPNPRIYRILQAQYGLCPGECLFVDDMEVNTEAAARLGFHTITLTGGASALPEAVERYLARFAAGRPKE